MSRKGLIAVLGALMLMSAGAYVWCGATGTLAHATGAQGVDAASAMRLTLDPNQFKGQVKDAYQVAQRNPALLAQLHCYCGCDKTEGHRNLLDCFRDKHGSTCAICVGEAKEAEVLANQGMPVEQIRDALRRHFGKED